MAHKRQLAERGITDSGLTRAVQGGEVTRVRNGWYSTLGESDPALRAVRVGGRLTGISAVKAEGGWVLGRHPLHVSVFENAGRLRTSTDRLRLFEVSDPGDVQLHWDSREVGERGTATRVGLVDALRRVVIDESFETAVAALDWALHGRAIDESDLAEIAGRVPLNRQGVRDWVDPACESLPESLTRTRLRLRGHRVESQVRLSNGQRIDLVVDGVLGIEVDGDEYHRNRFEPDRSKDLDITIGGLHALRPSARAVFHDWERVELAVHTAIAAHVATRENSGDHRPGSSITPGITGWRIPGRRGSPEFSE